MMTTCCAITGSLRSRRAMSKPEPKEGDVNEKGEEWNPFTEKWEKPEGKKEFREFKYKELFSTFKTRSMK